MSNLFEILNGDKDLNNPRELSAEDGRSLVWWKRNYKLEMWIVWVQRLFEFWLFYPLSNNLLEY